MERRRWFILVVLSASILVLTLDNLILNVALPTLSEDLHASTSELQAIVDAYVLAFAGLLLTGGSLGDRFGRRRIHQIGLVTFGLGSLVAAGADSATVLIACRFVMGVGAALALPASLAIMTNVFEPGPARNRAFGIWSAMAGLGLGTGPIVGGLLLGHFWWGSIFVVNVPIVVVALAVGWWLIPESRDPRSARFDPVGVTLSIVGTSGLVGGTILVPTRGWTDPLTIGVFVVAALALAGFVVWELRQEHPLLDLRVFRSARFTVANAAGGIANFGFAGTVFVLTQLLQSVHGYSALSAGLHLLPFAVTFIATGLFSTRIAARVGANVTVAAGLGGCALGLLVLAVAGERGGYAPLVLAMVAIGPGFGLTAAPTTQAGMEAVSVHRAGFASGAVATTKQVGTAFGVAVLGSLLVSGYQAALEDDLDSLALSNADAARSRDSIGSAMDVAHARGGRVGGALEDAAHHAFVSGMRAAMIAGIVVLTFGIALVLRYLPSHNDQILHAVHPHDDLPSPAVDTATTS